MNDIWVCDACKSINRMRDGQCYHCRAPRSGAMETPGLDLRAQNAAAERSVASYVISWPLALISVVLLLAVAVLGLVVLKLQVDDYPRLRQAFVDAIASGGGDLGATVSAQSVEVALLGTLRMGLIVLALITFAGWLALATRNVPLLGGGTPSRSPQRVFVFTIIPLWHLLKVPGMIQDVLYRVDPQEGGAFMVLAAWVGLVGSAFVNIIGNWAITSTAVRALIPAVEANDEAAIVKVFGDVLDQSFWLAVVVEILIAFGTIVLAGIMVRIESRCAARDREIREQMAMSGAPTPPVGPTWVTEPVPEPASLGGSPAIAVTEAPAKAAYEPNWPVSRPFRATSPTDAPDVPPSPAPASPDPGPPGPPPPPPEAPRIG